MGKKNKNQKKLNFVSHIGDVASKTKELITRPVSLNEQDERDAVKQTKSVLPEDEFDEIVFAEDMDEGAVPLCETGSHEFEGECPEAFMFIEDVYESQKMWMCALCALELGPASLERYGVQNSGQITKGFGSNIGSSSASYWDEYLDNINEKNGKSPTKYASSYTPIVRSCSHTQQLVQFKSSDSGDTMSVLCSAFSDRNKPKEVGTPAPALIIYLASSWLSISRVWSNGSVVLEPKKETPTIYIDWPDFGVVPLNEVHPVVELAFAELVAGRPVEVGCLGAHGRTGTFVSLLMVRSGWKSESAIKNLRDGYCNKAVENKSQEKMVAEYYDFIRGDISSAVS